MDPTERLAVVTRIMQEGLEKLAEAEQKRISAAELAQMQTIHERQVREEQEKLIGYLVTYGRKVE